MNVLSRMIACERAGRNAVVPEARVSISRTMAFAIADRVD
jgi:hypothetical protein